jgi:catalase
MLAQINEKLAADVALGLGIAVVKPQEPLNHQFGADANPDDFQPIKVEPDFKKSPALSMANTLKNSIKTRQIAILAADRVDAVSLTTMKKDLEAEGAVVTVVAPHGGFIKDGSGKDLKVDKTFLTTSSVMFDAVFVPSGKNSVATLIDTPEAIHFINEAYLHCKAIAAFADGANLIKESYVNQKLGNDINNSSALGLIIADKSNAGFNKSFIKAIANHRFFEREKGKKVPA